MRKTKIFSVSVLSSFVNPRTGTIVSDQDPAKPGVGSKIPIKKAWISSSLMKSKLWKGVSSNFFFFASHRSAVISVLDPDPHGSSKI